MRKRFFALAAALIVLSGCTQTGTTSASPSAATTTASPSPAAKANTFDVQVDTKSPAFNLATTAYFPNALQAHPGDTVRFTSLDRGEPHTVAFGTLIDAAAAALAKQPPPGPNAPPPPDPPEIQKLPRLIIPPGPNGPPTVAQAAGQPCFVAKGDPPAAPKDPCPKVTQPDFDGTQSLYNSGWLPDKAVFNVKLAETTKPGVYTFMCLLHQGGMTGQLTVVDKSQPVQPQDALKAKADAQLAKMVQGLQGPATAAAKNPADKAVAGSLAQDVQDGLVLQFGPKDLAIPVGGSVTWTVFGPHTVSFNGPQDAVGALIKDADGTVRLNPKAFAPQDGPGQPPPPAPPPAGTPPAPPPPGPIVIDSGPWDGKTFRSSGLFLSFPPVLFAYKVTFTQAGTYPFRCNLHPDMEGTVKVGQ